MASILIIESSTEICSVALTKDGKLIDMIESEAGQNHARLITVFAEDLLKRNNIQPGELSAVAVSKGPGSYTGLRIGVSTAKGFCFANGIPLIAVGTLEAMAKHVVLNQSSYHLPENPSLLYCPMIDARRMEVYAAFYNGQGVLQREISADIITPDSYAEQLENHPVYFFGNGADKCKSTLTHPNARFIDQLVPLAENMIAFGVKAFTEKRFADTAYFEPFYLKEFQTTAKPPKKLI